MTHGKLDVTVRFGDCDPAGIVFYPNFFRWFENACWQMFSDHGFARRTLLDRYGVVGWPLISSQAVFRNPATEGDRITVEVAIERFGNTSFQLGFRIVRDETLVCDGTEHRVWAARVPGDTRKLAPQRIPDEVRAAFPMAGAPVG